MGLVSDADRTSEQMRLEPFKYKVFRLDWRFLSSHIEQFLPGLLAGMPLGERSQLSAASITL
ncbi:MULTISPECIES: hypothetical protein [unclassified Microcoleus]|uniref:hypothetical protein n=1 Tax=unclassified Microcoleus TaxID=2642155 RepID=UPI002FCEEC18